MNQLFLNNKGIGEGVFPVDLSLNIRSSQAIKECG